MVVKVGKVDSEKILPGEVPQTISVESAIVHPDYIVSQMYNDIGLLKLTREIKFSPFVRPACLNTQFEFTEENVVEAGWGALEFLGPKSPVMWKGKLDVFSVAECSSTWKIHRRKLPNGFNETQQLCAGFKSQPDRYTCGDSGSPLQTYDKDIYCMYNVIGINSAGKGCNRYIVPDLYVRISSYVSWIEDHAFGFE